MLGAPMWMAGAPRRMIPHLDRDGADYAAVGIGVEVGEGARDAVVRVVVGDGGRRAGVRRADGDVPAGRTNHMRGEGIYLQDGPIR